MNRPTRVPASSVVRMNSASNMMAKWYQSAIAPPPPSTLEKSCAMPTARLGAPPVRESSVRLADLRGELRHLGRVEREAPLRERPPRRSAAVVPMAPAGALIAK